MTCAKVLNCTDDFVYGWPFNSNLLIQGSVFLVQIGISRKEPGIGGRRADDKLVEANKCYEEPTSYWLSAFFFPQGWSWWIFKFFISSFLVFLSSCAQDKTYSNFPVWFGFIMTLLGKLFYTNS